MKTRPILFSAPMVRALLAGTKTQTRRISKLNAAGRVTFGGRNWHCADPAASLACPYGRPGDRLWAFMSEPARYKTPAHCLYRADGATCPDFINSDDELVARWCPSIHMPRWASRIMLEITDVRSERLHAISESDAIAEGAVWAACGSPQEGSHIAGYAQIWESINGVDSWNKNPWVWAVSFKRVIHD